MLPSNTLVTLQSLYLGNTTQTLDSPADVGALFSAGEQVSATVVGSLGSGRFAVQVNNQLLDLNLPAGASPGDKLDLTVIANRPTLTFALSNAPTLDYHTSAQTELSGGMRYLADLLNSNSGSRPAAAGAQNTTAQTTTTQSSGTQSAAAASSAAALFEGPPDTAALAGKLAQTLGQSGLFYESHQAQWISGQLPLQILQQEPQARLLLKQQLATATQLDEADSARAAPGESAAQSAKAAPASQNGQQGAATASARETPSQNATAALLAKNAGPDAGIASLNRLVGGQQDQQEALASLVQRQLDVIDRQAIIWQGQAWPEQPMQWSVQEDGHQQSAQYGDADDNKQWRTTLNLQLPRLGQVSISAMLSQGQFSLQFQAAPDAVKQLQAEQVRLGTQFESAGLALAAVSFAATRGEDPDAA